LGWHLLLCDALLHGPGPDCNVGWVLCMVKSMYVLYSKHM
jgi:hypothetical protein